MGKGAKRQRKAARSLAKTHSRDDAFREDDIDDEIDAFHKQRDVIPLDVNNKFGESEDEDLVEPVFDFEDSEEDDSDNTKSHDDDEEEDEESDGANLNIKDKGFAAKIVRQAKYLHQKFGTDDEMDDHEEEEEEGKKAIWGRRKDLYYSADNVDYELQSSDEDLPLEEEAEVLKIQREKAKSLSMEDFGLENVDKDKSDSDEQKKMFQDAFVGKTVIAKSGEDEDYEEIKKDFTSLSKEEQMDVVYSSAPELVGLLSELNESLDQVQKLKPVLLKVGERTDRGRGRMHYFEVKQALWLSYCQAINYYLLLKSEGHPVRDHPVIARLVEIKNLLEKVKKIDVNVPSEFEKIVNNTTITNSENVLARGSVPFEVKTKTMSHSSKPDEDLRKANYSEDGHQLNADQKKQDIQLDLQSLEMLKIREKLEAKLKQKGIYNLKSSKLGKVQNDAQKAFNGRLRTFNDFDDDVQQQTTLGHSKNLESSSQLRKLSQLVGNKTNKSKVVSGDDDLPKRDDVGERRRRHELRVLARAGAVDDDDLMMQDEDVGLGSKSMDVSSQESDGTEESEDEFYKQVKRQRVEKLMAKAEKYARTPAVPSFVEPEADGKRQITYQMEKNRGLTRSRKKLTKNPRKKYRHKHEKQVIRRKGQVRDIRKPSGPYGGEATGINTSVSRSIRFKG
ncbi:something about silencing protein 10 isoform X4 [Canna indica]|uniref:Something about silencing protein 10 isoform X4 n=1 Tax=Canna indica TaxID=4628 RepID=A0AAQ3Q6Z9_9LILI|nr:something about silencing protein 10 isoform X4 [Canna indica]